MRIDSDSETPAREPRHPRRGAGREARLHEAPPRVRLGTRDLAILAWLARHRFATASQIGARFGIGPSRTSRRLRQLRAAGYVRRLRPFSSPSVYLTTHAGAGASASELPPARLDLRTYRHHLGITELALALELAGLQTVSEREMRFREETQTGSYAARLGLERNGLAPRLHFPDLVVEEADGSLTAFELELTPKRTGRLRAILKAYRRSPHIGRIVYYVEGAALQRRLEELARSLQIEDRLELRRW